ncbi:M14 family metallocarboxypeptidase [Thalassotalea sp. SU-HH00458]|uniref:M14 family metallopeptidase n=1 Tax=Thalassotalea sp. SU-HH00458 TaxID=3127657 RepID=UPI0031097CBC
MNKQQAYPIGKQGKPWGNEEKQQWFALQSVKRSYYDEVITKINALKSDFEIEQYGALPIDEQRYPLFILKSKTFDHAKKTVLVTGGVHGYETSGVQGALLFAKEHAHRYESAFNFLVAPCLSPWGYETINRWNPNAIDPNRSFYKNSPAEESAALISYLSSLKVSLFAHFDLHETTDSDNAEFRPALAARDATVHDNWNIPDGFYLVGNTLEPQADFQKAIIENVKKVTHIAAADENNQLIGSPVTQPGVINYSAREYGLCMGLSDAKFVTTTEVYPDSPKVSSQQCNLAQVAVITGGLDYILTHETV